MKLSMTKGQFCTPHAITVSPVIVTNAIFRSITLRGTLNHEGSGMFNPSFLSICP